MSTVSLRQMDIDTSPHVQELATQDTTGQFYRTYFAVHCRQLVGIAERLLKVVLLLTTGSVSRSAYDISVHAGEQANPSTPRWPHHRHAAATRKSKP